MNLHYPGKKRLPSLKLSPGTDLNDSKREAALKELLDSISEEQVRTILMQLHAPHLDR